MLRPAHDNDPRHQTGVPGVESWFLRLNHPTEPKALWLKATVLVPAGPHGGEPVAEAWAAWFDGDHTTAVKHTVPLRDASFLKGDAVHITIGGCTFRLGRDGGEVKGTLGTTSWDLTYHSVGGALGAPLCAYPSRKMIDGGFPKNKLLTPVPCAIFTGAVDGKPVDGWIGMQGHNWGASHAHEYAWGHAVFAAADGAPHALVEGFTGRTKIGPLVTPRLSSLIVRRGEREYRFDRVFRAWRQKAELTSRKWTLQLRGDDGDALLVMQAATPRMVCLGYMNPDGALSYCLNSKLAEVLLRVNPVDGEGFECRTPHGGALEFLVRQPDPSFPSAV